MSSDRDLKVPPQNICFYTSDGLFIGRGTSFLPSSVAGGNGGVYPDKERTESPAGEKDHHRGSRHSLLAQPSAVLTSVMAKEDSITLPSLASFPVHDGIALSLGNGMGRPGDMLEHTSPPQGPPQGVTAAPTSLPKGSGKESGEKPLLTTLEGMQLISIYRLFLQLHLSSTNAAPGGSSGGGGGLLSARVWYETEGRAAREEEKKRREEEEGEERSSPYDSSEPPSDEEKELKEEEEGAAEDEANGAAKRGKTHTPRTSASRRLITPRAGRERGRRSPHPSHPPLTAAISLPQQSFSLLSDAAFAAAATVPHVLFPEFLEPSRTQEEYLVSAFVLGVLPKPFSASPGGKGGEGGEERPAPFGSGSTFGASDTSSSRATFGGSISLAAASPAQILSQNTNRSANGLEELPLRLGLGLPFYSHPSPHLVSPFLYGNSRRRSGGSRSPRSASRPLRPLPSSHRGDESVPHGSDYSRYLGYPSLSPEKEEEESEVSDVEETGETLRGKEHGRTKRRRRGREMERQEEDEEKDMEKKEESTEEGEDETEKSVRLHARPVRNTKKKHGGYHGASSSSWGPPLGAAQLTIEGSSRRLMCALRSLDDGTPCGRLVDRRSTRRQESNRSPPPALRRPSTTAVPPFSMSVSVTGPTPLQMSRLRLDSSSRSTELLSFDSRTRPRDQGKKKGWPGNGEYGEEEAMEDDDHDKDEESERKVDRDGVSLRFGDTLIFCCCAKEKNTSSPCCE